jgi:predicted component of type VI protein secretion system
MRVLDLSLGVKKFQPQSESRTKIRDIGENQSQVLDPLMLHLSLLDLLRAPTAQIELEESLPVIVQEIGSIAHFSEMDLQRWKQVEIETMDKNLSIHELPVQSDAHLQETNRYLKK